MTTPAQDVNLVETRLGCIEESRSGVPPVKNCTYPVNYDWYRKKRPASTTVPFTQRGFRGCKPWSHSGLHITRTDGDVTRFVRKGTPSEVKYVYSGGSYWGYAPGALTPAPASLKSRAEIAALTKLKDQKVNLGVFLAELHKSVQMIGDVTMHIARAVNAFRSRNPKKIWALIRSTEGNPHLSPTRVASLLPSQWLQLQYGWLPLLSDVKGILDAMAQANRLPIVRVSGFAGDQDYKDRTYGSAVGRGKITVRGRTIHKCFVSLQYTVDLPALARSSQLGLVDPASIVWECLPYSFVVDWFAPVGSWISAAQAAVGMSFLNGSCSILRKGSDEVVDVDWANTSIDVSSGSTPRLRGDMFEFSRTCYGNSPVPGFYLKNPVSGAHALNGLALLAQAFSR